MYSPLLPELTPISELQTLVEHRSVYCLDHYELNIFETHNKSEKVSLVFNDLVITAMLRGKKVMHLPTVSQQPFEYLPGESVIVPGREIMKIDFPEASVDNPTQCLAVAISSEKIKETIDFLNEKFPRAEAHFDWNIDLEQFHLKNSMSISNALDRLIAVSREDVDMKPVLADFTLKELIVRLMQTQASYLFLEQYKRYTTSHRFSFVVDYIKQNIRDKINIKTLSDKACMSEPNFYRTFKREFGITPIEFILAERLKIAKQELAKPQVNVTDAAFRAGFNSVSYFFTAFKRHEGISPSDYKKRIFETPNA